MQHILVPIGSTESAKNTLEYAIDFANAMNAKVFVFRAYSSLGKAGTIINVDKIIERETNLYLRTIVNSIDRKNVDVKLISAKGSEVDSVQAIHNKLGVDLIIIGAKANSIKEEVFLGKTAGKLVKQTEIPILTVPTNYKFKEATNILMAFKSGKVTNQTALIPIQEIKERFNPEINLLLVKTPNYKGGDLVLNENLKELESSLTITENATTFQGVLEHFQTHQPDMLCVFRRKRGFFQKLWEKNTILKKEFHTSLPLLILKGNK